jgi:hypothetical protein
MNIHSTAKALTRTAPNVQASRKGALRKTAESAAGFVGGVAGAVMYAGPTAGAAATYAQDRWNNASETGYEAIDNTFVQAALAGTIAGGVVGGLSNGWLGAGIGAVLGFAAGGVGGYTGVMMQHVAGHEEVNGRLGKAIRTSVDKTFEGKGWGGLYSTKDKTAAAVKGIRVGLGAGVKTGFEIGEKSASGAASGLIEGVNGFATSLTYRSEAPDTRSIVKKALNVPLGLASGVLAAVVTAPVGVLSGRNIEREGDSLKFVWGTAATLAAMAVGGALSGSVEATLIAGATTMVASIALLMGDNDTAKAASSRINSASWAAKRGNFAESDDSIHANLHDFVQDRIIGTGAALNGGFVTGYRAAGTLTDGLVDASAGAAKSFMGLFPKAKEVASGIKEGLS